MKVPHKAQVEKYLAYPYEALEESVVNAAYHRSYDNTQEPTKIYLYPDRLEIISYPGPVQGIEKEQLENLNSRVIVTRREARYPFENTAPPVVW